MHLFYFTTLEWKPIPKSSHNTTPHEGLELRSSGGKVYYSGDCGNKIHPTHIKRYSKVNVCKSKKNDNKDNQALTLIAKTDLLPPIDPW